jgi:tetratricopeptide (TPR) repeat protein
MSAPPAIELPWFLRERVRKLVGHCILEDRDLDRAAQRLAQLDAEAALSPYGMRMWAGLKLHHGDPAGARALLDRAIARRDEAEADDDFERNLDVVMLGETLNELGEHGAALRVFTALIDDDAPTAARHHGRGVAHERGGELEAAAAAYRAALELAEAYDAGYIRVDLARVLEARGDRAAAIELLSASEDCAEVPFALARLLAVAGRTAEAAAALGRAFAIAPEAMRARIRADAALADPALAAVIAEPVIETRWLDAYPTLAALRDAAGLHELGVRFADEAAGIRGGDELRAHYADSLHLGTLWTDSLWTACRAVAAPLTLIAAGPDVAGSRNVGNVASPVLLFADLGAPDHVWLAPSETFPAALFTRVASTPAAVADAIRRLFLDVPRIVTDLPAVARAVMGYLHEVRVPNPYSGELEEAGPHELERHFNFSPSADPQTWGTAFADDPWPDRMPAAPATMLVSLSRDRRAQQRGGVARITRRTLFSRSHLGIEIHQPHGARFYVWHVRFRPNPFPETIERYNAAANTHFPTDLPADVVASVIGFGWATDADLVPMLDHPDTEHACLAWQLRAGLRHGEVATTEELRRWIAARSLAEPQRAAMAQLCLDYGWRSLLDELVVAEPPGDLRDRMLRVLELGIPEPTFNEMGEPDGLYPDEDDEDDDEEEP